ncbi:hypothetical protein [Sediminitomix flava]|uniref:Outer membrane protein with beta-barrel domain n=1 Tax=Sediminitomix flava TaxID=379075 RepID=A0A315Z926_SEDFL|nr:hypothetical protein [Sediminitomix flava]PWJ40210.1 hypothetical protein BC781_105278 [Sediminitomix flava]
MQQSQRISTGMFLFLFILLNLTALGTDKEKGKTDKDRATIAPVKTNYYHRPHQYIALKLGALGVGVNYAYTINKLSGVRFGINYFGFGTDQEMTLAGANFNVDYTIQNMSIEAYYEYFPFHKKRGRLTNFKRNFKFVMGLTYFAYVKYHAKAYRMNGVVLNGTEYSPSEIGDVVATVSTNRVAPYLGLGSAWNVPNKRRAKYQIGFDLGLIYHGKPRVNLVGTNFLEGNSEQQEQVESNLSFFQFYPNLSVKLIYRLH